MEEGVSTHSTCAIFFLCPASPSWGVSGYFSVAEPLLRHVNPSYGHSTAKSGTLMTFVGHFIVKNVCPPGKELDSFSLLNKLRISKRSIEGCGSRNLGAFHGTAILQHYPGIIPETVPQSCSNRLPRDLSCNACNTYNVDE